MDNRLFTEPTAKQNAERAWKKCWKKWNKLIVQSPCIYMCVSVHNIS